MPVRPFLTFIVFIFAGITCLAGTVDSEYATFKINSSNGSMVEADVTWLDESRFLTAYTVGSHGVFFRLFDPAAGAMGAETLVAPLGYSWPGVPVAVARMGHGGFALTWGGRGTSVL